MISELMTLGPCLDDDEQQSLSVIFGSSTARRICNVGCCRRRPPPRWRFPWSSSIVHTPSTMPLSRRPGIVSRDPPRAHISRMVCSPHRPLRLPAVVLAAPPWLPPWLFSALSSALPCSCRPCPQQRQQRQQQPVAAPPWLPPWLFFALFSALPCSCRPCPQQRQQ